MKHATQTLLVTRKLLSTSFRNIERKYTRLTLDVLSAKAALELDQL